MDIFDTNPILRKHQEDALAAIYKILDKKQGMGKILLPTGTGKTRIEVETVCEITKRLKDKDKWGGVHVVLSPRILLAYQQLENFAETITQRGSDYAGFKYMVVNSGGLDSAAYEEKLRKLGDDSPEEIPCTTANDDIVINILDAQKEKRPLIIFSTYHSAWKIDKVATDMGIKIQSYIFDEAQYCVTSGVFQDVPTFDCNYRFYFTATEKDTDSDEGLGMNNKKKFGEILFTESPRTLIERGEMASVGIHLVGTRGQDINEDDYESKARAVLEAFDKHRIVLKEHSFSPDKIGPTIGPTIGPKMVVVCDKQDSLKGIMDSKALKEYRTSHPSICLCALSSNYGIKINDIKRPRPTNTNKYLLLETLRKLSSEDEAIVFHVDMISEGIDVKGLTAVMPFRNLGKNKFLQNLGRGTRLVNEDRRRLYSGEIKATDWGKYIKPRCWLILPVLGHDYLDMKKRYEDYIYALRSSYGFNSSEMVVIDDIVGPPDNVGLPDMAGSMVRKFNLGADALKELVHSIEDSEAMTDFLNHAFKFNTMTADEQVKVLREVYAGD